MQTGDQQGAVTGQDAAEFRSDGLGIDPRARKTYQHGAKGFIIERQRIGIGPQGAPPGSIDRIRPQARPASHSRDLRLRQRDTVQHQRVDASCTCQAACAEVRRIGADGC